MKNRTQRLLAIKKIISGDRISSQDELLNLLNKEGYEVTQATLSRDLKSLQVMKISDSQHGYIYRLRENLANTDESVPDISHANFLADGFLKVEFSGNLGVVRTLPGYASSIASVIDKASLFEILGTVAGDDTILLIVREGVGRNDVINALIMTMPKLEGKID